MSRRVLVGNCQGQSVNITAQLRRPLSFFFLVYWTKVNLKNSTVRTDLRLKRLYTGLWTTPSQAHTGFIYVTIQNPLPTWSVHDRHKTTDFFSSDCRVVDFHLTKMVRRKYFVPGLYQLWKGRTRKRRGWPFEVGSKRGFSVESSLQRISSNLFLWKRNDSSVVL